jgi:hypothetical protein
MTEMSHLSVVVRMSGEIGKLFIGVDCSRYVPSNPLVAAVAGPARRVTITPKGKSPRRPFAAACQGLFSKQWGGLWRAAQEGMR